MISIIFGFIRRMSKSVSVHSYRRFRTQLPEVFEISPAQSAERSISGTEAARLEAEAIKSASGGQYDDAPTGDGHEISLPGDKVSKAGWCFSYNTTSFGS